jgi:hypothetical protein
MTPSGTAGSKAFLDALTSEELAALKEMKKRVPELCEGRSDSFLMKFLWARKLDISRAIEVLEAHLKWREEWQLNKLDTDAVETYLSSGLSYWIPGLYSRQGYSPTFIVPRKLDLDVWQKHGSKGMLHATYYVTDMAGDHDIDIARQGTMVVIDFAGASWSDLLRAVQGDGNFDLSKLIDSGQNHMPSRVRDVILLNAPWWIRMLLGIVKPLLKSNLRKKIHSGKTSDLVNYFTPENIPVEWGGERKFNPEQFAQDVIQSRPELSEGKYIDASSRSDETVRTYSGAKALGSSKHSPASISKSLSKTSHVEAQ